MPVVVTLDSIGKSYNFDWIFRNISMELNSTQSYAVLGGNGSGKSTFLKIVAGAAYSSEGTINYTVDGKTIEKEKAFSLVSLAAPYQALFEEFTFKESIDFQSKFKPFKDKLSSQDIIEIAQLPRAANGKPIKYYSSGMKQRAKLALAILADTPILLLDEPASNLDKKGIEWFATLVQQHNSSRLVMVASNRFEEESGFCTLNIEIERYK